MDTEIDSAKTDFSSADKQIILQSPSLELADYQAQLITELQSREISTVFVYGVPMQACIDLCIALNQDLDKVWLVQDATKSYKANERQQAKDLREHGIKLITVRNLEQYLEL
jgi:nicotinamidase-related amidase